LTATTVLIAALAGRGLAASARRAGYLPLVADAFGDSDTSELAHAACCVRDAARIGFRTRQTIAALDELAASAPSPPIGLVLGSGFEDRPKLVDVLARRFALLGNDAATITRCKHPASLSALLDTHDIAHPLTRTTRPDDPTGWISKRVGGSGGTHILPATADTDRSPRRYFQRRLDGTPYSILAIATRTDTHLAGVSRQWSVGEGPRPYRYGGAVGPDHPSPACETKMRSAASKLSAALRLVGLVSFDFLVADDTPYLLEINPRPGATLDVFDDAAGALFEAHIAACTGSPITLPATDGVRAASILYADRGALEIGLTDWPDWTADRPAVGAHIPRYRPIATVFASAQDANAAIGNGRRRLEDLGEMLYGQARN